MNDKFVKNETDRENGNFGLLSAAAGAGLGAGANAIARWRKKNTLRTRLANSTTPEQRAEANKALDRHTQVKRESYRNSAGAGAVGGLLSGAAYKIKYGNPISNQRRRRAILEARG